MSNPLISAEELKGADVIILDARGGPDSFERYKKSHLKGALYADLEKELSTKQDPRFGGRHPLPTPEKFAALLTQLGVNKESHVVAYDDMKGGNAAARLWWMLRAAGVENSQVLDGGFQSAVTAGLPLATGIEERVEGTSFTFETWLRPTVTMHEVQKAITDPNQLVIDVREAYRFNGESEPIDIIAGHIPQAVNVPYIDNLDSSGKFLDAVTLAKKYKGTLGDIKPENVIVHCGSGVTACHTLLAMEQAGIKGAKLYVGSWSEWSRNKNPLVTGS